MTKLESEFVHEVFKPEVDRRFPGGMFFKLNANQLQGVPDLLFLYEDKWATFETKRGRNASKRPNQEYYVNKMNDMSYSAFVDPDNMHEVLDGLQKAFGVQG